MTGKLVKCPTCHKAIAESAGKCIHCGEDLVPVGAKVGCIIGIFVFIFGFGYLLYKITPMFVK